MGKGTARGKPVEGLQQHPEVGQDEAGVAGDDDETEADEWHPMPLGHKVPP